MPSHPPEEFGVFDPEAQPFAHVEEHPLGPTGFTYYKVIKLFSGPSIPQTCDSCERTLVGEDGYIDATLFTGQPSRLMVACPHCGHVSKRESPTPPEPHQDAPDAP